MTRLPRSLKDALAALNGAASGPEAALAAVAQLLESGLRLEGLSAAIESFRDGMRSLGLLEEPRQGEEVYAAWLKLARFSLGPLEKERELFATPAANLEEAPPGLEACGARWERVTPELAAFFADVERLDRSLAEAAPGTHLGYRFRSRLLVLDRRAERLKIAVDLLRRDILDSTRQRAQAAAVKGQAGEGV
jgi:hypothetical protein